MSIFNLKTLIHFQVMTVIGYAESGYILSSLSLNDADTFLAPWYSPSEGFYSRLEKGQKVLTKKVVGDARLCHIVGLIRNTIEDTVGVLSNLPNEKILNTKVNPLSDSVKVFKRGIGSLTFSRENISLLTPNKDGIKIIGLPNRIDSNLVLMSESSMVFNNGFQSVTGRAYFPDKKGRKHLGLSLENMGNVDDKFYKNLSLLGLFPRNRASETPERLNNPRNYNRFSFRHMSDDFTGFDNLIKNLQSRQEIATGKNYNDIISQPFYRHFFLPNESAFFVTGGIFSLLGYEFDMNFNELVYGYLGRKPKSISDISKTEKLFKRGSSFFFSTNNSVFNESDVKSSIDSNNYIISDRDGLTKVNLKKSSFFGNLPLFSTSKFTDPKDINSNISDIIGKNIKERNPIVFSSISASQVPSTLDETRPSGVRFSGVFNNNLASQESSFVARMTKHHNLVAAGEQIFANYIDSVYTPAPTLSSGGKITSEKFERRPGISDFSDTDLEGASPNTYGRAVVKSRGTSYVTVSSTPPAISSGGSDTDLFYAGKNVSLSSPMSNDFSINKDGGAEKQPMYDSAGGYSALLDAAGAMVMSVGKSDTDGVSVMLDTEGSVVSWIGKDKNNRSIVTQTDGSVSVCIGGPELRVQEPEPGQSSAPLFNEGRFDMRVALVDKGFVGEEVESQSKSSDYIISISSKGLVISGGTSNVPIVISSVGDLNLESQTGNVNLVANNGTIRYKKGASNFYEVGYRDSETLATGSLLEKEINR